MTCHYATSSVGPNMSFEDLIFWSYVDLSERPEGYSQKDNFKCDDIFMVLCIMYFKGKTRSLRP